MAAANSFDLLLSTSSRCGRGCSTTRSRHGDGDLGYNIAIRVNTGAPRAERSGISCSPSDAEQDCNPKLRFGFCRSRLTNRRPVQSQAQYDVNLSATRRANGSSQ
jgi:hypothetical protein